MFGRAGGAAEGNAHTCVAGTCAPAPCRPHLVCVSGVVSRLAGDGRLPVLRWAESLGPCAVSPLAAWSYSISVFASDAIIFPGEVNFLVLVGRMRQGMAIGGLSDFRGVVSDGWKPEGLCV